MRAHTHTRIHPGRHVRHPPYRTVGMWKSLEDVSTYVLLCPLYVSHITKRPIVEAWGKCIQVLVELKVSCLAQNEITLCFVSFVIYTTKLSWIMCFIARWPLCFSVVLNWTETCCPLARQLQFRTFEIMRGGTASTEKFLFCSKGITKGREEGGVTSWH